MTPYQLAKLQELLVERGLVLDRVYYDYKQNSINFRCNVDPTTEIGHVRVLDYNRDSVRYAIMPDGSVANRNTDRRFLGV